MRTRAFVVAEKGAPFVLQDVELDEPGDFEVLIQVVAASLCATDLHVQHGVFPAGPHGFPTILGHETSGRVVRVGSSVTRVKPGDDALCSFASCNECAYCKSARPHGCSEFVEFNFDRKRLGQGSKCAARGAQGEISASFFGQSGFGYHALVAETSCVKVPKGTDLVLMSPLGCGLQTGAGAVLNQLKPDPDDTVAIFGLGAVGMGALFGARELGVKNIIVIDLSDTRLALAAELGATHALNGKEPDLVAKIQQLTRGLGVDKAVEATGSVRVLKTAFDAMASCGHLCSCGTPGPGFAPPFDIHDLVNRSITYSGLAEGGSNPPVFIKQLISLYEQGKFPVDKIAKTYTPDQMDEAIAAATSGEIIKPIIVFGK